MTRTKRTFAEIEAAKNLDLREKRANAVLADSKATATAKTNAERDLRGIDRKRKTLAE